MALYSTLHETLAKQYRAFYIFKGNFVDAPYFGNKATTQKKVLVYCTFDHVCYSFTCDI